MKKILFLLSLGMFVVLAGCLDWIDVNPKTDLKTSELYSSETGFKSALIGLYVRMTWDETYGKNLSFDFIERLTQRYDNFKRDRTEEERAKIYQYKTEAGPKNTISEIWKGMYRNIANINNLLQNLEMNGDVITTKGYRDMITGEALGLRAFHYFDLLRMWGPVYQEDSTALTVPWRDQFSPAKVPQLPANELVHKILHDLKKAEQLLNNDPMIYLYNGVEPFIGERGNRMNKYAVKALTARVYLYTGNKVKAKEYAEEVIGDCGLKLVIDNQVDVAMFGETLFALGMHNMPDRVKNYWKGGTSFSDGREYWISTNNIEHVFQAATIGVNDIRYKSGYGFVHGLEQYMCRKYLGNTRFFRDKVPLIRLSEMYYILAESVELNDSPQYINAVRNARGISYTYNIQPGPNYTESKRMEELQKEYQKDFFAEGQFFFFLKRHHATTFYRCPVDHFNAYVFPVPDAEIEFGSIETNN